MSKTTLSQAIEQFEIVEANLTKLERLCEEIYSLIPKDISFGSDPVYEDRCRTLNDILAQLPKIDGWKPELSFPDLDTIAQNRFDLAEINEPLATVALENELEGPSKELRDYRFKFNKKRRALIRDALQALIDTIDGVIQKLRASVRNRESNEKIDGPIWDNLKTHVAEINTLLGSSVAKPERWSDLNRHLHFAMVGDFHDIEKFDWPAVKAGLIGGLFGKDEAIPSKVSDLADLVSEKPVGPIPTKLNWSKLSDEEFERLAFTLIANEPGYENPEWLMQTRAADKGRDLSVTRITKDALTGNLRHRVIIQCKHWQKSSISIDEVARLKEQMRLWGKPRVDILIIATSGRFTADAVDWIERHNRDDTALRIEMWPESHLEMLLSSRPALIAEFGLR
jgi:Restriction endonuclease